MLQHLTRPDMLMILMPMALLLGVIEMVRRRRLREDYSLLWVATFSLLFILAIFRDALLTPIARVMGVAYPPAALFVICFGLLLVISLQFSTVLTKLAIENKQSAQHMALLNARIRELERRLEQQGSES
jgi:hypothetical protein